MNRRHRVMTTLAHALGMPAPKDLEREREQLRRESERLQRAARELKHTINNRTAIIRAYHDVERFLRTTDR